MSDSLIYIPFPRDLYDDIIRFSDGGVDPVAQAEDGVRRWIERTIEDGDNDCWLEDRLVDLAGKYAPYVLAQWEREDAEWLRQHRTDNRPLVWKDVTVASGAEVRMFYKGVYSYVVVKGGQIVDDGKEYTASEWASKVAGGTTRNAWRDLWFKEPLSKVWVPAQMLRDQVREEHRRAGRSAASQEVEP